MKSIHLHGELAKQFGRRPFIADISSTAEAVRAMTCFHPAFKQEIRKGSYHVVARNAVGLIEIGAEDILLSLGKFTEIHITPILAGAKNSGTMKIVLGIALVAGAFFFAPIALAGGMGATAIGTAGMGITYGQIAMFGVGLALTGVSQMLSPSKKPSTAKSDESFLIGNSDNTVEQGVAVPVVIGRYLTSSVVISMGVATEQIGSDGITYPNQG